MFELSCVSSSTNERLYLRYSVVFTAPRSRRGRNLVQKNTVRFVEERVAMNEISPIEFAMIRRTSVKY
jgi:hypothetical protein